ncbi:MAG TPA: response regulator [Armatimonadota bacterium]|nr:response regulator [Armatimonadota bacterium]
MAIEKVLIADDDEEILEYTSLHLSRKGLKVTCAHNGQEALDKIEQELPDIVLLDILMPRRDGWEVCRFLKANPATRHIPVLFLTCKGQDEDILKIHRADADGYFIKPFDIAELAQQVANWKTKAA